MVLVWTESFERYLNILENFKLKERNKVACKLLHGFETLSLFNFLKVHLADLLKRGRFFIMLRAFNFCVFCSTLKKLSLNSGIIF